MKKEVIMMALVFVVFSLSANAVVDENLELDDGADFQITSVQETAEMSQEELQELKDYVKEELGSPGITPDSRFYFLNNVLDVFKSNERVANERAAAMVEMANRGDEESLQRAMRAYESALERRSADADNSDDDAEAVAEQTSKHLEVLAKVRDIVPEQARESIGLAMERSAEGRERSIERLSESNPERGQEVAERTMKRVMENTPDEAQQGLEKAFENVQQRTGKSPDEMKGGMPGQTGQGPSDVDTPEDINAVDMTPEIPDNSSNQDFIIEDNAEDYSGNTNRSRTDLDIPA